MTKSEAARLNGKRGGRPKKGTPKTQPAKPTETQETHAAAPPLENPFDLSPKELLFVEAYCGVANFNATEAYALAGYKRDRHGASHLATRYNVAQAIAAKLSARVQQLRIMDGQEAMERLSLYARADIGKVLHPDDPLAKLPDDIRLTIKTVRPTLHGRVIELYDSLKATELIAKSAGKLNEIVKFTEALPIKIVHEYATAGPTS